MKKLVFVISYLYGGGAERVTAALASEISRWDGYQVHIITYSEDKNKEYPLHSNVICHVMPKLNGGRLSNIASRIRFLRSKIKEIDPCCVLSLGTAAVKCLLLLSMIGLRIPLILSERNDPKNMPKSKFDRMIRLFVYASCDGVVFQTEGAKNFFPKCVRKKSAVIANPITGNLPAAFQGNRAHRIVNFCRFVPQKNLGLLIDAFADIASEFPSYTLWIYGEGPERPMLEQKIVDYALTDRVLLPGYSNNIYADINDAALFVSSSDYEGISNSMLEAIAMGIPCVCTDCPPGGAAETIEDGVNGLLVPVNDRTAMANAMRRVLKDNELAERMHKSGVLLRNKLSVYEISNKWMEFINMRS